VLSNKAVNIYFLLMIIVIGRWFISRFICENWFSILTLAWIYTCAYKKEK